MVKYERIVALLKCLMAAYVITGIFLVILAAFLYKFHLAENVVEIGIVVVYILSSLLSGLFYAKGAVSRRFMWGMIAGAVYFAIICLMSIIVEQDFSFFSTSCLTTFFICTGSGMLGGMLG